MDIPSLQDFFLPVLKSIGSRKTASIREVEEDIRKHFKFNEDQMSKRVPNKTKTEVYDKVTWAMTHLFKAGLIKKEGRSQRSITELGCDFLSQNPTSLTWKDLRQQFILRNQEDTKTAVSSLDCSEDQPPNEILEKTHEKLKKDVLEELLNRVKQIHPRSFEELVLKLLRKMYGASETSLQHIGGPGDEGVDGVIFQDPLGCDRIYIQVKRYKDTTVGRPEIQKFQGALESKSSKKGIFITTSQFSRDAENYLKTISSRLILIDGKKLAELLYQYNVGIKTEHIFEHKIVDESFFEDN